MIEIATQGATESLDPSGIPMGEIGEGAILHFAVFAEGFAEEDGRWRFAIGDGGDVHTYLLSQIHLLSTDIYQLHDYTKKCKKNLTPTAIATYLNLRKGKSV